jgi:hypothetical protein
MYKCGAQLPEKKKCGAATGRFQSGAQPTQEKKN